MSLHDTPVAGKSPAKLSQSEVREIYDKMSPVYDIWGMLAESRARSQALSLANIGDGLQILEVAVGTALGFSQIVAANPSGTNVGIDISEGMLKKARKRMAAVQGNYELFAGSALDIPFADNTFDIVHNEYMFDLLSNDDMETVIMQFRRVLKPGGLLIVVNMTAGQSYGSKIYDLIYRISPKLFGGCRAVAMSGKLTANGFQVERREYIEQLLFPSEIIVARKQSATSR